MRLRATLFTGTVPMRRLIRLAVLTSTLAFGSAIGSADAQTILSGPTTPYRVNQVYRAPGYYGTSWGTAAYRVPLTYSTYSSPYGAGYAYGYAPYGVLPGRYGVGLWRQGATSPGYVYGSPGYSTYARPFRATRAVSGPPMGAYAPGFGPVPPVILMGQ